MTEGVNPSTPTEAMIVDFEVITIGHNLRTR